MAIWGYLLLGRGGFWRAPALKDSNRELPCASAVPITVIIPARDEAASVGAAVDSLRTQRYAGEMRFIVVDDHSGDRTAAIAREHGAVVLTSLPLPPGWTGKLWAVSQGIAAARQHAPEYLLLTDADIIHGSDTIARLVARADSGGFDLTSVMVRLRAESFAERALMPAFVFFFLMLYPPAWIENPRYRTAGAAGGCMLIRREALERVGGIEAIRGALIDDCALARAVKQSGGRVWLGLTGETRSVREYGGFAAVWGMISRTAFTQLNYSPWLLAATVAGLGVTYMAPPFLVATARWPQSALGAAAWFMMTVAYAPMVRFYRRSIFWAPALPAIAMFYAGATIGSAVRYWTGRGGEWKGRIQAAPQP